jgi:hypothetical protein
MEEKMLAIVKVATFRADDKFRTAYNLTYGTMGQLTAIDTTLFRRATWNYIQVVLYLVV